jgi:F0F1-type ATP synthase gamma subunit
MSGDWIYRHLIKTWIIQILDDIDISSELDDLTNGVKKALQIPFELEHSERKNCINFGATKGLCGGFLEKLRNEMDKL